MAFRRPDRRDRSRSFGINEEALSRAIKRAQGAVVTSGKKVGREATDAGRGSSTIYADNLAAARDIAGTGLGEAFRGLMSSADADEINRAGARREAKLLQDAQGVGASMLAEKSAEKQARAGEKLMGASIAGSVGGLASALGGIGLGISALPIVGQTVGLPLAIGSGITAGVGAGIGTAGEIHGTTLAGEIAKLKAQEKAFDMPEVELPEAVRFAGQDNVFTGGVEDPKRKRRSEDSFAEVLSNYSFS